MLCIHVCVVFMKFPTDSLKILQYQYPYLDPYTKQLKHSYISARAPYCKTGKLAKKSWRIVVICQSFFPSKVFYCTVYIQAKLYLPFSITDYDWILHVQVTEHS